jgi:hypothetical protein
MNSIRNLVLEAISFDHVDGRITLRWVLGKIEYEKGKSMGLAQDGI